MSHLEDLISSVDSMFISRHVQKMPSSSDRSIEVQINPTTQAT